MGYINKIRVYAIKAEEQKQLDIEAEKKKKIYQANANKNKADVTMLYEIEFRVKSINGVNTFHIFKKNNLPRNYKNHNVLNYFKFQNM